MIDHKMTFKALGDYLLPFGEAPNVPHDLFMFICSMQLASSGISLDQSFIYNFEEGAPAAFESVKEALVYCADFLRKELVDFWGYPNGIKFVLALEKASRGEAVTKDDCSVGLFVEKLDRLARLNA